MSFKSIGPEKRRASIHSLSFLNPFFAVLFAFLAGVCVNLFIHFNPECREFGKCSRTLYLDQGGYKYNGGAGVLSRCSRTLYLDQGGYKYNGGTGVLSRWLLCYSYAGYSIVQSIYPPTLWPTYSLVERIYLSFYALSMLRHILASLELQVYLYSL